ncbi:MAG: hypothetical protein VKP63_08640 [Cyanobacteriota bacterium]|nr:hypothetical protein [Cyanobacteriota bacterium]
MAVVDQLAGRLSATTIKTLNAAVDLERRTPEEVVRRWRLEASRASAPEPGGTGPRSAGAPGPGGPVSRHSGWRAIHGG